MPGILKDIETGLDFEPCFKVSPIKKGRDFLKKLFGPISIVSYESYSYKKEEDNC